MTEIEYNSTMYGTITMLNCSIANTTFFPKDTATQSGLNRLEMVSRRYDTVMLPRKPEKMVTRRYVSWVLKPYGMFIAAADVERNTWWNRERQKIMKADPGWFSKNHDIHARRREFQTSRCWCSTCLRDQYGIS